MDEAGNALGDGPMGARGGSGAPLPRLEDRTLSHAEVAEGAARMAAAPEEAGLRPGDRLAMRVPGCAEALVLARIRAGAVFLPLDTGHAPAGVSHRGADSGGRT